MENQVFNAGAGIKVILRPAVPDDAREIVNTVNSVSRERSYVMMEHYGKDEATERHYVSSLDRNFQLLLVAEAGGTVIGSLAALQADDGHNPQTAHIVNVGLHLLKEYRGLGIGTKMLNYAVEWAYEKGYKKLEASIFTFNERSLRLFEKAGFTEEGTRRKRYRIGNEFLDEVVMGKIFED